MYERKPAVMLGKNDSIICIFLVTAFTSLLTAYCLIFFC